MGEFEYSVQQASNIRPPRAGEILALSVDATSRGYDISALTWNGVPLTKLSNNNKYYLSMQCEGAGDVYFALDRAAAGTNSIDDTAAIAAGSPLVLPAASSFSSAPDYIRTFASAVYPAHLVAGLPPIDVRIDHLIDRTIIVKCASGKTATLRFWPSSQNEPGAE